MLGRMPAQLRFGTSGLRGRVTEMTDREVYVNALGFFECLKADGLEAGDVALARDRRDRCSKTGMESSPRILRAVIEAARNAGFKPIDCGQIPTPALAYFAQLGAEPLSGKPCPAVMVTGSHIPADRNGVKFYTDQGEVLKSEEAGILAQVAAVRAQDLSDRFDAKGQFLRAIEPAPTTEAAKIAYIERYLAPFAGKKPLAWQRIVFYEHSSVARELLPAILEGLGAEVICLGASDRFISVDTEDVTEEDRQRYLDWVREYRPTALITTDGDADRPLFVDNRGVFRRGDELGVVTARFWKAEAVAFPVNATDVTEMVLDHLDPKALQRTRVGSPYVIEAMKAMQTRPEGSEAEAPIVMGWESNGGFLTASPLDINAPWRELGPGGPELAPLMTRDAVLPLISVLLQAALEAVEPFHLFDRLPRRYSTAGLIDEVDPEVAQRMLAICAPSKRLTRAQFGLDGVTDQDGQLLDPKDPISVDAQNKRHLLCRYFTTAEGYTDLHEINLVDGIRMSFQSGEVVHLRASGNAPQFRVYVLAETPERADAVLKRCLEKPKGIVMRMMDELVDRMEL